MNNIVHIIYFFVIDRAKGTKGELRRFLDWTGDASIKPFEKLFPQELFPALLKEFFEPNLIIGRFWYSLLPKLDKEQRALIGDSLTEHLRNVSDDEFLHSVDYWAELIGLIGNDFRPAFASTFVDQCTVRYRKTQDRKFVKYIGSVTPPPEQHQKAIKLAIEVMSNPESMDNVTSIYYLLLSIDKLDIGDLEVIIAAEKRELRVLKQPTKDYSSPGYLVRLGSYANWRQITLEELDQCYDELDKRILANDGSVKNEQETEYESRYLAGKFRKHAEDLANTKNPLQAMLELFGPGRPIESAREREAGLVLFRQFLEKLSDDARHSLVADLVCQLREAFRRAKLSTNLDPNSYHMEIANGDDRNHQLSFDPEYQKLEFLLIGAAKYLDENQTIELLTELAEEKQLNWLATNDIWGRARPFETWLDGIDESQLTIFGHILGSKAYHAVVEEDGIYHGLTQENRDALEDVFSVFDGSQGECLRRVILPYREKASK